MAIGMLLFVTGCNGDGDNVPGCSTAWGSELQEEIDNVSQTAQAYANNPNETTCEAYRASLQAYLNALQPYGNCGALTGQDRAAWEDAVDQAQEDVDAIDCTQNNGA